ncbi:MAG TPA: guanylate kinase [Candidatus Hydrogenedentes bacterium]|nr:guanylate kinase [Candidatus Hydrogenedentota bacterium]HIJ74697.1 guanylate kinase [Candidatus Hydrogenedentota bacterium]
MKHKEPGKDERRLVPPETSLFVVSAPSGAGKRTILDTVFERDDGLAYAVSATTRPPRTGEVDGQNYFFLSEEAFRCRVKAGDFLEWAAVHGNLYGTLREELSKRLASGKDVVLELDVQGMRSVKAAWPDTVSVFVMAPSFEELERRLERRGANDPADTAVRLANARTEMDVRHEFDYIIVNDDLAEAVSDMEAIVRAARCRAAKQP